MATGLTGFLTTHCSIQNRSVPNRRAARALPTILSRKIMGFSEQVPIRARFAITRAARPSHRGCANFGHPGLFPAIPIQNLGNHLTTWDSFLPGAENGGYPKIPTQQSTLSFSERVIHREFQGRRSQLGCAFRHLTPFNLPKLRCARAQTRSAAAQQRNGPADQLLACLSRFSANTRQALIRGRFTFWRGILSQFSEPHT